jgi:hypothetical protein
MAFSLLVIAGLIRQSMARCGKLKRSMDARVKPGHDDD